VHCLAGAFDEGAHQPCSCRQALWSNAADLLLVLDPDRGFDALWHWNDWRVDSHAVYHAAGHGAVLPPAGTSPHVVAGALKLFLLTLPEPLLTYKCAPAPPPPAPARPRSARRA
jgi:hypothetical protein